LVTTGMKSQEEMVNYILEEADVKIAMWIGSSIDYLIWFQKRAPEFFRKFGLEWMYRLVTWPQKLKRINRIYQALVVFLISVILYK
jgi:N-acetylglucosaminyldiphosphoundecaprenol N-acetyl-beta-D-mannosaminyltransferase